MWVPRPDLILDSDLTEYLKRVEKCWPAKKTGLSEEIALKLLKMHDYKMNVTLAKLESSSIISSFEIV
jgi:hypothetical protein